MVQLDSYLRKHAAEFLRYCTVDGPGEAETTGLDRQLSHTEVAMIAKTAGALTVASFAQVLYRAIVESVQTQVRHKRGRHQALGGQESLRLD